MKNNDRNDADLLYLVKAIWHKKIFVITIAVVFGLASYVIGSYQKNSWTSDAVVTQPNFEDTYLVRKQLFEYKGLISNDVFEGLISKISQEKLFEKFINIYNSYDNKKKFILANEALNTKLNKDKENFNLYMKKLNIIINGINSKKEKEDYILSFKSDTRENSLKLLTSYIDFCNEQLNKKISFGLKETVSNSVASISNDIKYQELKAQSKIESELLKSKVELEIAQSAEVNKPLEQINNNELFSINLGSQGIETKIKNLQDNKMVKDIIFPELNYNKEKLASLQALSENINYDKFTAYSNIKEANMPIKKDGFSQIAKVLIGMFFGIVVSILGILIGIALKEK